MEDSDIMKSHTTIIYRYNSSRETVKHPHLNHFRPWFTVGNFREELEDTFKITIQQIEQESKTNCLSSFARRMKCSDPDASPDNVIDGKTEELVRSVHINLERQDDTILLADIRYNGSSKAKGRILRKSLSTFYKSSAIVKSGSIHALIASVPPVY